MSENEKQEGQKTVVAFIAGLLIGGLLVWVFSSSPAEQPLDGATLETDTEEGTSAVPTTENNSADNDVDTSEGTTERNPITTSKAEVSRTTTPTPTGNGALGVIDQGAGSMVVLTDVSYPATTGWIGVRDYVDGTPGNVLGAARFNTEVGLLPTSVRLLRPTEAGTTYQVVFYTEDGDEEFDLENDVVIEGISALFTAE